MKKENYETEDEAPSKTNKKIEGLRKQYNNILVDLFKDNAAECIECALEGSTGTIGGNIEQIVQTALDELRCKVLKELGLETSGMSADSGIDGIAIGGVEIGVGDIGDDGTEFEEIEGDESEEVEDEESEESDSEEEKDGDAEDEDDEDEVE